VLVPVLAGWTSVETALVIVALLIPVGVAASWVALTRIDRRANVPLRQMQAMRRNEVFAPLAAPQLEAAARRTRWMAFKPGEALMRQGEPGDRYYILESGAVEVSIDGRVVRTLDAFGDGMGEIALLRGVPRTATVTATTSSVLLAIDRNDFLPVVTGHEHVHRAAEQQAYDRAGLGPEPGAESG
jgi:signal-transduction protein with cAMP-binding, CBS, and nucleotidyltransferase domain